MPARMPGSVTTTNRQFCTLPPAGAWDARPQTFGDHRRVDRALEIQPLAHGPGGAEHVVDAVQRRPRLHTRAVVLSRPCPASFAFLSAASIPAPACQRRSLPADHAASNPVGGRPRTGSGSSHRTGLATPWIAMSSMGQTGRTSTRCRLSETEIVMGRVAVEMSMSLDGFVAGVNTDARTPRASTASCLHRWLFADPQGPRATPRWLPR